MNKINNVRGTKDYIDTEAVCFLTVSDRIKDFFNKLNFKPIITPVLEYKEVFYHTLGADSDIVNKEMFYIANDKKNIVLRPEATAAVVRSIVDNNFTDTYNKFYYIGPMFRHERPQAGRLRQFYQFGIEIIAYDSEFLDIYTLFILDRFIKYMRLENDIDIEINNIGCEGCRKKYRVKLKEFLKEKAEFLCENCKKRTETNPLRTLDCKNINCKNVLKTAPAIEDDFCDKCRKDNEILIEKLDGLEIKYKKNKFLVRGLDYYNGVVFEAVTDKLGAQNAVIAGGRYDKLMRSASKKKDVFAMGFAGGMERLLLLLKDTVILEQNKIFIKILNEDYYKYAFDLIDKLLKLNNKLQIDILPWNMSLKASLRKANKENVSKVLIIGEDEIENNYIKVKDLKNNSEEKINLENLNKIF